MTLPGLALVLAAAVLHAGWNLLAKQSRNTVAFFWWAVLFGAVGSGLLLLSQGSLSLPPGVWPYFLLSDLAELVYFVTLVRGYREGDLSLVYPLSRGSAPVFIAAWSALLFGERLGPAGYGGIGLMTVGIYVASLSSRSANSTAGSVKPVLWALASGLCISIYSLSDKVIVASMSPVVYNFWVYAGNAVTWLPIVWLFGRARGNFAELKTNWPRIIAGSVMTVAAYIAVLVALTFTPASYVVAGRGTSVIIGALLGWLALKESFGSRRVLGSVLMVIGLAAVTLAK